MGRRGHNEGTICKRSDGRWVAVIDLGLVDGKRKRKSLYGTTRKEVQEKLNAALGEAKKGLPLPAERLQLGAYLDQWLSEIAKSKIRAKTYHSYKQQIRLHLKPGLGHKVLAKLTPQDVQQFLNRKLESGLSPRTVEYLHSILRAALNKAVKWGLLARNVVTLVDPPRVQPYDATPLDPEQARKLLATLQGDRLEALFTVPIAVGLRPGEALALKWSDIDWDKGVIKVTRGIQRIEGKLRIEELKTKRSRRAIALPAFAITSLKAHRARQAEERLLAGPDWQDLGLLFTTWRGTPLEPRFVAHYFKGVLKMAGLPDTRVYDLRHTCATLLLVQGVHPRVVMEILGHSQISLTMNTYSHVVPQMQEEAASKMDDLLSGRVVD